MADYEGRRSQRPATRQIAATATSAPTGVFVGLVVAHGDVLLLITVPCGMVLTGAASGIAAGLHSGLRDWLYCRINKHASVDVPDGEQLSAVQAAVQEAGVD